MVDSPYDEQDEEADGNIERIASDDDSTNAADTDAATSEILDELVRLSQKKQSSAARSLVLLAVSLILFAMVGLFHWEMKQLGVLILVLIVHEFGHFLGMNIFGYRDVKMFFIPFFGAAVSGKSLHVDAWKKAIVLLLGPVPGVCIGLGLTAANMSHPNETLSICAGLFLYINAFNLLPILPLDGGQLVHLLVFCRNRYAEGVFRFVAAVAMIGLGWTLSAWLLLGLGVIMLLSCGYVYHVNAIADRFRGEWDERILDAIDLEVPPDEIALAIHAEVAQRLPAASKGRAAAQAIQNVWERLKTKPPGILASMMLLLVYGASIVVPVVAFFFIITSSGTVAVVEVTEPDGTKHLQEQTTVMGKLFRTIDVSDQNLYHGKHVKYRAGQDGVIAVEGEWRNGHWHGAWKHFDRTGQLAYITVFDEGKFVSIQKFGPDAVVEDDPKSLPDDLRAAWRLHRANAPEGPAL